MRGVWRNSYKVQLHDLYTSPYISVAIKSKSLRLVGHVTGIGETKAEHRFGGLKEWDAWNTLPSRWQDNIKTHLKKRQEGGFEWTGFNWLKFITRGNTETDGWTNFPKNVKAISRFQAPEGLDEANSMSRPTDITCFRTNSLRTINCSPGIVRPAVVYIRVTYGTLWWILLLDAERSFWTRTLLHGTSFV